MKAWKKSVIAAVTASLLVAGLAAAGQLFNFGKEYKTLAEDVVGADGIYKTIPENGTLGTESNPFVVLEIVPNELQAQMGYLVAGQEPVKVSEITGDSTTTMARKNEIVGTLSDWFSVEKTDLVSMDFRTSYADSTFEEYGRIYKSEDAGTADRYAEYVRVPGGRGGNYELFVDKRMVELVLVDGFSNYSGQIFIPLTRIYVDATDVGLEAGKYEMNPETGKIGFAGRQGYLYDDEEKKYVLDDEGNKIPAGTLVKLEDELRNNAVTASYLELTTDYYEHTRYVAVLNQEYPAISVNDTILSFYYDYDKQYRLEYVYSVRPVADNSGEYRLIYKNYEESKEIAADPAQKSNYNGQLVRTEQEYNENPGFYPDTIGAIPESVALTAFYQWKLVNNDLFKKYALGLNYKNETFAQGEDVAAYEFLGWYYEPEGVNRFNATAAVAKSTNVYAKWAEKYTGESKEYTISFDPNVPEDEVADGFDFSMTIERIAEGSRIVAPSGAPHRTGYTFTGWYIDTACTRMVQFPMSVNSSATLYAGWKAASNEYLISFNLNTVYSDVFNAPETIVKVQDNNRTVEDVTAKPVNPERNGYTFGGWYWDSACRTEYDFLSPVPKGYSGSEITLYAQWIPVGGEPTYVINFNKNEPASAKATAAGTAQSLYVKHGQNAAESGYSYDSYQLTLEGNIAKKLQDYDVRVVTVTPGDLSKAENLKLIDRANLIVISEPAYNGGSGAAGYNRELADIMRAYRNTNLFPAITSKTYISTKYSFSEAGNDLSFEAVKRIFARITGLNDGIKICPVIMDYSVINNIIKNGVSSSEQDFKGNLSDGEELSLSGSNRKAWSSNLYKLYLMTQQINPVTLWNAYISDDSPIEGYSIDNNGNFVVETAEGIKRYSYWNNYTLIPWNTVTKEGWTAYEKGDTTCLDLIGVTFNSLLPSGSTFSKINHRMLVMNNSDSYGIASAFRSGALPMANNEPIKGLFGEPLTGDTYSLADGIYYMLSDKTVSENFDKDLHLLELEPSGVIKENGIAESFKDESYWFWLVSRYVPDYSGKTKVTRMSTSEFIGDIQNVNSTYDILYVGGNNAGIIEEYMPLAAKRAKFGAGVQIMVSSWDISKPDPQTISGFSRWEAGRVIISKTAGNGLTKVGRHILLGNQSNGNEVANQYSDKRFTINLVGKNDKKYRVWINGTWVYCSDITASFTNPGGGEVTFGTSSAHDKSLECVGTRDYWTSCQYYNTRDKAWYNCYFYISDYYASNATDMWVHYNEATKVNNGDTIILDNEQQLIVGESGTYVYSHIGRVVTANGNAGEVKRDTGYLLSGRDDVSIEKSPYSGNDLTNVKYKALKNFIDAGYPVIIGSELMVTGAVNTNIVDTASYMYKFLSEVNSEKYSALCFHEGTTGAEHDKDFIKALKNKSFEIKMLKQPVEYHDYTRPEWRNLKDSEIYVNGGDITAKTLEFIFVLDSTDPTDTYTVKFFIDTNADGKFSEVTEMMDSVDISEVRYNSASDTYSKVSNAREYSLKSNKTYKLVINAGEYVGVIPWKLEVVSNTKKLVSDDFTGMSAFKSDEKASCYVLQILPNANATIVLPSNKEVKEADENGGILKSVNNGYGDVSSGSLYNTAQKFYKYTRELNDFEVEYFRLTVDQFTQLVNDSSAAIANGTISATDTYWFSKLEGYGNKVTEVDRYVDNLWEVPTWNPDLISYEQVEITTENGNKKWVYHYRVKETQYWVPLYSEEVGLKDGTLVCKNKLGNEVELDMLIIGFADVYTDIESNAACDVINEFINSGKATLFTHDTTSYHNKLGSGWGYNINRYFRNILKLDRFDVTEFKGTANPEAADWPFTTGSNGSLSRVATENGYVLNQGFTNLSMTAQVGANISTKVTKSNDGQITCYPYYIPDKMTVAQTHAQYYQIDFEDDDIVVWYSISDYGSNVYKTKNDVRNNYYIYNCGNITYSGVGHSASTLSDDETKLFVNTMVAAYKAITSPAKPTILNTDKASNKESLEYLYIDYDETVLPELSEPLGDEIVGEILWNDYNGNGIMDENEAVVESVTRQEWKDENGNGIVDEGETTEEVINHQVTNFYKRVFFNVKSYGVVLNKTLTMHIYPIELDKDTGNVINRLREYPMNITAYRYNPDNLNETPEIVAESPRAFSFQYQNASGDVVTETINGPEVKAGEYYYVDIPLNDRYYSELFAAGPTTGTYRPAATEKFALDSNSSFGIRLDIIMRYGRDQTENRPLSDAVDIVFTRRGLFNID